MKATMSAPSTQQLHIAVLHDDKPGHLSQLHGLTQTLTQLNNYEITWISVSDRKFWQLSPPKIANHKPDLLLAAGHRTHRWLLQWGHQWSAPTCAIMRPSLPLAWFDAVICPQHDAPPARENVLSTRIALNPMQVTLRARKAKQSAILLGGPSRHWQWDDSALRHQITSLIERDPTIDWVLAPSRRTPDALIRELLSRHRTLQLWPVQNALADLLRTVEMCWISPDSFSMISESLTLGIPTGIFAQKALTNSRVAQGVTALQRENWLIDFNQWHQGLALPQKAPLNENLRAAQWLLQRVRNLSRNPPP